MTETIKLPNYCEPDWENASYGSLEELKEMLLHKRIVKWDKDFLLLEDSTRVTIEMSESDWGETTSTNTVTIYHNQNPIALAECEANDGNGGHYYSVASLVIGEIHFPVVEA